MKVFLSHSHEDINYAKQIKEALKPNCDVYIASEDRQPGKPLSEKIEAAIRSCSFLVALLTKEAESSPWVHQEIGFARACKINIILLVDQDIKPKGMPEGLEYIVFDRRNPEIAIKNLNEFMSRKKKEKDLNDLFVLSLLIGGLIALIGKAK